MGQVAMKRSRLLDLLVATVGTLAGAGCSLDESPTAASLPTPSFLLGTGAISFLTCSVLSEQKATLTVDASGGSFTVGYAKLTVPKGALLQGTARTFVMRTPSDPIASVIFTPVDGLGELRFDPNAPAKVKFSYKHCTGGDKVKKKVVYTSDANDPRSGLPSVLEDLSGVDDSLIDVVEAAVQHFSRYAVAW